MKFNKSKISSVLRFNFFYSILILLFFLSCYFFLSNRPVLLVFEYDRFRVVHQSDLTNEGSDALNNAKFSKNKWLAEASLRPFKDGGEQYSLLFKALNGYPLSFNSGLWQNYEDSAFIVVEEAKKWKNSEKLKEYFSKYDSLQDKRYGYLPVIGRDTYWTAKINLDTAEIIGLYPVDPYD
nr:hypothetical protein [Comamonas testosteroni]